MTRSFAWGIWAAVGLSMGCSEAPNAGPVGDGAASSRLDASVQMSDRGSRHTHGSTEGDAEAGTDPAARDSGASGALSEDAAARSVTGPDAAGPDARTDSGAGARPVTLARDGDAGPGEGVCRVQATPAARTGAKPTVWLVVDGSGSMVTPLAEGEPSRWSALHESLLGDDGIVKGMQDRVQFGLMIFDGPSPGGGTQPLPDGGVAMFDVPPAETCPRVFSAEPALNNASAIEMLFTAMPLGGSTPTDRVLQTLVERYQQSPPEGMISVVLATDGEPNDFCSTVDFFAAPIDVRPAVVGAVETLLSQGITTYALSLAGSDQNLAQHLADVAAAGGTGTTPFSTNDVAGLNASLRTIVGDDTGCDVVLGRPVDLAHACDGTVSLRGKTLPCDGPDGYHLRNALTLRLDGEACEAYQGDAELTVEYPCVTEQP